MIPESAWRGSECPFKSCCFFLLLLFSSCEFGYVENPTAASLFYLLELICFSVNRLLSHLPLVLDGAGFKKKDFLKK